MKVTLSKIITCELIFRVEEMDPIDEGNMRRPIRQSGSHSLLCKMEKKNIREGKMKRENQQEKKL